MTGAFDERVLEVFAAAAVHALRTPLAALSGEVELALRRDRSAEAYREALTRIAQSVAELVELTEDIAILGQPVDLTGVGAGASPLAAVLSAIDPPATSRTTVVIESPDPGISIAGAQKPLARALRLLVEQALRHSPPGTRLILRVESVARETVDLILEATPPLLPDTWRHLGDHLGDAGPVNAAGLLRLRTAARMIGHCGGTVSAEADARAGAVRVTLLRVLGANQS